MTTLWKAQVRKGDYSIQFDTDNEDLYRSVEKACQDAVDKANELKKKKERVRTNV